MTDTHAKQTHGMDFPGDERDDEYTNTDVVQSWGTEYEWFGVVPREPIGSVAVIHYVLDEFADEWTYAEARVEHITQIGT